MKGNHKLQQFWWTADLLQELKETSSADQVEGFRQVNEGNVQRLSLLTAFLLKLSEGEDHVDGGSLCPEAALGLGVHSLS